MTGLPGIEPCPCDQCKAGWPVKVEAVPTFQRGELRVLKERVSEYIGKLSKGMVDAGNPPDEISMLNEVWDVLNRMVGP